MTFFPWRIRGATLPPCSKNTMPPLHQAPEPANAWPLNYQYIVLVPSASRTFFDLGSSVHEVIELVSKQQKMGIPPTKETALVLLGSA